MSKTKTVYVCTSCGHEESKWYGRCSRCGEWNTLEGIDKTPKSASLAKPSISDRTPPKKLTDVQSSELTRYTTGNSELDRVLGGGVVKDSVVIVSGEPGAGKSTIILQASNSIALSGKRVLYISGEESEEQIKGRADRILEGNIPDSIWIKSETCMNRIQEYVEEIKPDLLIVDSIQTIYLEEHLPSRAGGSVQTIECANALISIAKKDKIAVFLVGHVNKDSEMAGVKTLEHMVDTVIYLEGDRRQQLRIMRSIKNRFGNTDEIGCFTMEENGLLPIDNLADYFITKRDYLVNGVATTVSMEGSRPLIIEIESLVDRCAFGNPMRIAEGVNKQQLQVLTAILEKRAGLPLGNKDVYVKVSGGIRLSEPAVNLGVIMAIASSATNQAIDSRYVFIGEVGLTGEVKSVTQLQKRLKELDRLGFKKAFIPKGSLKRKISLDNLKIVEIQNVKQIIDMLFK